MPTKQYVTITHHFNKEEGLNQHELTDKPSEIMEQWYLDKYYLLVRRIPGLSMSIEEYMNTPTIHINQLYNNEMEVIRKEQEEQKKMDKGHSMRRSDHLDDSESAKEFEESLFQDYDPETGEILS